MAKKVEIDLVKAVLQRNEVEVRKVAEIIEDLNRELERLDEEDPKLPPVKKQFVMVVSDPEGMLEGADLVGWVAQIPEEESPALTLEKIIRASYDHNASPKGRRLPVQSIGEACEHVQAKFFKEQQVWIKTKEPMLLLRTDNKIPTDFES